MATYSQLVQEIRAFLRAADLTRQDHMRQLAAAYAEACEAVKARLAICEDLLQRGMKKEAVLLAQVEPPLLDAFAALDFADRNTWDQLAGSFNLPCPAKFRASVVDALRKEIALQRQRPTMPSPLTSRPSGAGSALPLTAIPILCEPVEPLATTSRFPTWILVVGLLIGIILTGGVVLVVQLATEGKQKQIVMERNDLAEKLAEERQRMEMLESAKTNSQEQVLNLEASLKYRDFEIENLKKSLGLVKAVVSNQEAFISKLTKELQESEKQINGLLKDRDNGRLEAQKLAKVRDVYKPIQEAFKNHKALSMALETALQDPSEKNQVYVREALASFAELAAKRELEAYRQYHTVQNVFGDLQKAKAALKEYEDAKIKNPPVNKTVLQKDQDDMMTAFRSFSKEHANFIKDWGDTVTGRHSEIDRKLMLDRISKHVTIIP